MINQHVEADHQGKNMPDNQNDHQDHEDHKKLRDEAWEKQNLAYEQLLMLFGDNKEVVLAAAELPLDLKLAFGMATNVDISEIVVECIDDGMPRITFSTDYGAAALQIGIGGAGILLDGDLDNFVAFLAQLSKGKKIKIRSHGTCGAAEKALTDKAISKRKLEPTEVDLAAQSFGRRLANKLTDAKDDDVSIVHEFVSPAEMTRPEIHTAMGAVVDTTGRYNQTALLGEVSPVDNLPKMFNIAAFYGNAKHVAANVEIAKGIAFGAHGFQEKFTPEHPFILMVVVDKSDPKSVAAATELTPVLNTYARYVGVSKKDVPDDGQYHQRPGCVIVKTLDITGINSLK